MQVYDLGNVTRMYKVSGAGGWGLGMGTWAVLLRAGDSEAGGSGAGAVAGSDTLGGEHIWTVELRVTGVGQEAGGSGTGGKGWHWYAWG